MTLLALLLEFLPVPSPVAVGATYIVCGAFSAHLIRCLFVILSADRLAIFGVSSSPNHALRVPFAF